jgi:hypothetical protein
VQDFLRQTPLWQSAVDWQGCAQNPPMQRPPSPHGPSPVHGSLDHRRGGSVQALKTMAAIAKLTRSASDAGLIAFPPALSALFAAR